MERVTKAAPDSYPPYNVEQLADGGVEITLAVAGFAPDQMLVQVEANQLTVAGRREADGDKERDSYLHRGIAARGFQRAFVLADGMEVADATLEHGLLRIRIVRPEPERRITRIPIRSAG